MSLPPSEIPLGAMRFNSDSQKLEYWMGSAWMQIQTFSPTLDGGVRGLFGGGSAPSNTDRIDFITISTAGDTTDFGDIVALTGHPGAVSNSIRGVFGGGYISPADANTNVMEFITIASTGNAADFGDLLSAIRQTSGISDSHGGLGE